MPTYEYECTVCGTHFTRRRHFSDPPVKACPQGHHAVRRLFSPPAIVFKGSGFYVTDNRNSKPSNPSTEKEDKDSKPAD
ncbi:MAG: zinc ribbon domain-containing protein [Anaerolineae bacterium]|nr:zinc ribbon domain-containing protein [Anaerolineae bacterium]